LKGANQKEFRFGSGMIKHKFLYKDEGRVKLILMLESIPDENDIETSAAS